MRCVLTANRSKALADQQEWYIHIPTHSSLEQFLTQHTSKPVACSNSRARTRASDSSTMQLTCGGKVQGSRPLRDRRSGGGSVCSQPVPCIQPRVHAPRTRRRWETCVRAVSDTADAKARSQTHDPAHTQPTAQPPSQAGAVRGFAPCSFRVATASCRQTPQTPRSRNCR